MGNLTGPSFDRVVVASRSFITFLQAARILRQRFRVPVRTRPSSCDDASLNGLSGLQEVLRAEGHEAPSRQRSRPGQKQAFTFCKKRHGAVTLEVVLPGRKQLSGLLEWKAVKVPAEILALGGAESTRGRNSDLEITRVFVSAQARHSKVRLVDGSSEREPGESRSAFSNALWQGPGRGRRGRGSGAVSNVSRFEASPLPRRRLRMLPACAGPGQQPSRSPCSICREQRRCRLS